MFHNCIRQSCPNLVCGVLKVEEICSVRMIPIQEGSTELCIRENCILFLLVYTHGMAYWFSWPHDTLPFLIYKHKENFTFDKGSPYSTVVLNSTDHGVLGFFRSKIHPKASFTCLGSIGYV